MTETASTGKCRSCGAAVYFAKTESGKWAIMDAKPERRYVIIDGVAKVMPSFNDHHATCPNVHEWRQRRDVT